MKLSELQEEFWRKEHEVTEERLVRGALILTILSEDDGLTFNNGRTSKPKRLVVIGIDKRQELCYGSVLVNTKMNPRASYSDEFLSAQYLLQQKNYSDFLDYDSFVDCGVIFSIPLQKLKFGMYYGLLNEEDLSRIMDILETTDTLSTKQKKQFGIKRR